MTERLLDVRTPLAASEDMRVEIGRDGTLHVVMPSLTVHLERARCEELTTMLARALVRLRKIEAARLHQPRLRMVARAVSQTSTGELPGERPGETARSE